MAIDPTSSLGAIEVGMHPSGGGIDGGGCCRWTGSEVAARSATVPNIRTRSTGEPATSCSTDTWAVEKLRPTRSTSGRSSTGPGSLAERK